MTLMLQEHRSLPGVRGSRLRIGLVNNMADGALQTTERQFETLLRAAMPERRIDIVLFDLSSLPRGPEGRAHLAARNYRHVRKLADAALDGVIVTGTEPKASDMRTEACWSALVDLFDWITCEGPPAVFSCLAAHAAVLHFDGIERRRLVQKCSGLFDHERASRHFLTDALSSSARIAHSRWHELPAEHLKDHGYQVLTAAAVAGVDLFVRQERNLLMFFQGHPEYDADALAREYKRDVRRYLRGERGTYPRQPQNYFAPADAERLLRFEECARAERDDALMTVFPLVRGAGAVTRAAEETYRAWLAHLAGLRSQPVAADRLHA